MNGHEWREMLTFAGVVGASGTALHLTFEKWIGPRLSENARDLGCDGVVTLSALVPIVLGVTQGWLPSWLIPFGLAGALTGTTLGHWARKHRRGRRIHAERVRRDIEESR